MKKILILMAAVLTMMTAQTLWAHGDASHTDGQHIQDPLHGDKYSHNPCSMGGMGDMKSDFMKVKVIDGFDVTFHIMKAMKGMNHGGSYNVMIKVAKDGEVLTDITVNSKVRHPNNKSESKMMMKMGTWYMASYDLNHPGNHQIMVLFKTSDGTKHFGGIDFLESDQ